MRDFTFFRINLILEEQRSNCDKKKFDKFQLVRTLVTSGQNASETKCCNVQVKRLWFTHFTSLSLSLLPPLFLSISLSPVQYFNRVYISLVFSQQSDKNGKSEKRFRIEYDREGKRWRVSWKSNDYLLESLESE